MHRRAGRLATAEEMLREALEIEIVGSAKPGEVQPALETLLAVEARYAQAYEPDSVTLMNMRNDLAWGLLEAGRLDEPQQILNEVTSRIEPDPENAGQAWRRAHLFSAQRALKAADPTGAAHHLAIARRELGPYDMEFDDRIRLELLARDTELALGAPVRAQQRWRSAEAMAVEHLGRDHPLMAQVESRLQEPVLDLVLDD
ncbi:MAG: hypothetical protein ACLFQ2_06065 [Wenzhouxiangella sp.]